jgi:hypothetical protein
VTPPGKVFLEPGMAKLVRGTGLSQDVAAVQLALGEHRGQEPNRHAEPTGQRAHRLRDLTLPVHPQLTALRRGDDAGIPLALRRNDLLRRGVQLALHREHLAPGREPGRNGE